MLSKNPPPVCAGGGAAAMARSSSSIRALARLRTSSCNSTVCTSVYSAVGARASPWRISRSASGSRGWPSTEARRSNKSATSCCSCGVIYRLLCRMARRHPDMVCRLPPRNGGVMTVRQAVAPKAAPPLPAFRNAGPPQASARPQSLSSAGNRSPARNACSRSRMAVRGSSRSSCASTKPGWHITRAPSGRSLKNVANSVS